jgi:hypothetical protein
MLHNMRHVRQPFWRWHQISTVFIGKTSTYLQSKKEKQKESWIFISAREQNPVSTISEQNKTLCSLSQERNRTPHIQYIQYSQSVL